MDNLDNNILQENINNLDKSLVWLKRSYDKAMEIDLEKKISTDEFDIMENLTSRYSRAVDLIINKVFRSIDAVELEDSGSVIDLVNRAEKRGLIESAMRLRELKDLRNEIVHEYETEDLEETFKRVRDGVSEILQIAQNIKEYCCMREYYCK